MYLIYSAGLALALLVTLPYWMVQAARKGKYRIGLRERFGAVPARLRPTRQDENCIWIHAVSVGEVIAVSGIITSLQTRLGEKGWRIAISTTTATGQKLAQERFGEANVFYFPVDFAFALRPYFRVLRPRLVILAETEFWPNFLRLARSAGAKVAVVNARISDRSFPRYRSFRGLLGGVLRNVDIFLAQSDADRERLVAIGADPGRVQVSGNLKFDITAPQESRLTGQLRAAIPRSVPVVVCGSTVEGEEELLLDAFARLLAGKCPPVASPLRLRSGQATMGHPNPGAVMILAPRHPERFAPVGEMISSRGLPFIRRSNWNGGPIESGVFLLDTIGELASVYALATAVFVGGSLVPRGGHNILEAAQFGRPIFVGPHTENFRDIINIFKRENAVHVLDLNALNSDFASILDPKWQAMGERALQVFRSQAGATQRTLDALEVLMWMPSTIKKQYDQVQR
jgi:3-deoxy-D-manno-octulosonic-acid transferase